MVLRVFTKGTALQGGSDVEKFDDEQDRKLDDSSEIKEENNDEQDRKLDDSSENEKEGLRLHLGFRLIYV